MRIIILGFISFLFSSLTSPVLALEPPGLISPANGSTVTAPTLNWQIPTYPLYSGGSPYRVQVDDNLSFASVNKDRYKTTTSYSPEDLSEGTWYWRVKAKDVSGAWSDWSNIWSFIVSTSVSTPTPSPTNTPSPIPTPTTSPKSTSSFIISSIPSQINSDQSFNVSVDLTLPNNKNTDYYLSGAFKKVDVTRYFGLTKINSNWVPYNSSNYLNQYKITTDDSGNWTGTLEVKPDTEDSDYKGSGDYIFKVARYSSNSTPTWSSESTIKIISAENNQDEISANIPSSTTTPLQVKTSAPSPTKNYERLAYRIASVAAATASAKTATSEASIKVKNQRQTNPLVWIGLIFIFAGVGSIGYIYLKSNAKIPFKFR